jgi:hypothetical protein
MNRSVLTNKDVITIVSRPHLIKLNAIHSRYCQIFSQIMKLNTGVNVTSLEYGAVAYIQVF